MRFDPGNPRRSLLRSPLDKPQALLGGPVLLGVALHVSHVQRHPCYISRRHAPAALFSVPVPDDTGVESYHTQSGRLDGAGVGEPAALRG
jgi:hypothetical protein